MSTTRHMVREAPITYTPGIAFIRQFCFRCRQTKDAKDGRRLGIAKLFVCLDCLNTNKPTTQGKTE